MAKKKAVKKTARKAPPLDEKFKYKQKVVFRYIPDVVLKYYREKMRAKNDWAFRLGAGYFYTESGVDIMLASMGLRRDEAQMEKPERHWVQIDGISRNPKRLKCLSIGDNPRRINVTVLDSTKFKSGDFIPVNTLTFDSAVLDMINPTSLGVYIQRI